MKARLCPQCNRSIAGHPNKRFCSPKCKDRYHNLNNPRGIYAHLRDAEPMVESDYDDQEHPFSSDAIGQE